VNAEHEQRLPSAGAPRLRSEDASPFVVDVLLVDDDEDDRILTAANLSEMPGVQARVTSVSTASEAIEQLQCGSYDIALLDFHLGSNTGLDILASGVGERTPCVMLTGQADLATDLAVMEAGAADYLVKGDLNGAILGRSIRYAVERAIQRKRLEAAHAQLRHEARHDPLTGLPNRTDVIEEIERQLQLKAETETAREPGARQNATHLALLFIDLDDFKAVNDTRGHLAGDEVLVSVARRLLANAGEFARFARLGGDEFAVLIQVKNRPDAAAFADRIVESINHPFQLDEVFVRVGASIGIAFADESTPTPTELMRNADVALYEAKRSGRNTVRTFSAAMGTSVLHRVTMEHDLRNALLAGEITTHFQPLFNLETRRILGFEALVRWNHPTIGLIRPATFIAVAESIGAINDIGRYVLNEALETLQVWRAQYPDSDHWKMSVNLSPRQLDDPALARHVQRALTKSGCAPEDLVLEITESVMLRRTDQTFESLNDIKELGVSLAMDDFGTGFSSLSYLHELPLDTIKIDRSFVERCEEVRGANLIRAIVALAESLGLSTVAEGVERAEQVDILRSVGCVTAQGSLVSMPMSAADLADQILVGSNELHVMP
jgi:diguanylate cyclase